MRTETVTLNIHAERPSATNVDGSDATVLVDRRIADLAAYLDRLPDNLQEPRHTHDEAWQRGAIFVRDQVRAILERNYEPTEALESEVSA